MGQGLLVWFACQKRDAGLSMEEVAGYFLFGVDEGYFEIPDNSQILSIAGFLAGLYSKFDPLSCLKLASRIAAYRIAAGGKLSGIPNLKTIIKKGFEQ